MTKKNGAGTAPADKASSNETSSGTAPAAKNSSKQASDPPADGPPPLHYVGIGASAGGLEALRPFVAHLPACANMTYIVAQHMSPDHRSLMVELLVRETQLKVEEARNNVLPKADTIYVAPPNTDITVANGKLRVSKPANTVGPKPSVDRFFMSLAADQEDKAIGIILSGTGSDGAHGIKAIRAAGGISIAQDPKSAKYDSMPNAAIRAGGADLVLPPNEIATQLVAIAQRPQQPIVVDAEETPTATVRGIVRQIAAHTGMDFSNYKEATISRQIARRMAALQIRELEAYGDYLSTHHHEFNELVSNFLVCVTSFFRDPECFEGVRRGLKEILKSKRPGDDIRIWIPGCATGEEVYSLAILLAEELGDHRDKYRIQIFATDINAEAVNAGRAGVYPEAAVTGVAGPLIAKYFTAQDGIYRVDKSLRDMTLFARQDLIQDPPFVRLDMVSCRNLLIYFKGELQDRVVKIFHYALRTNGVLFLGKSESIGRLGALFVERDRKNKIYLKRPVTSPVVAGFAHVRGMAAANAPAPDLEKITAAPNSVLGHDRLFDLYTPASILMTVNGEILEIFGDCSPFLTIKKGKADFNVFTLVRPPFRTELRAFAHRVTRSKQSAFSSAVAVTVEGKNRHYRLGVHHCSQQGVEDSSLLLVCFEAVDERTPAAAQGEAVGVAAGERIAELEQEIVLNRENLQTVIEELETANEELQSLNEEAQAANEELQASNEELETANEELQASNEELTTVNDELGSRTQELSETNTVLTNILNSVYKAIVVVDRNLNILRHNKLALHFFDITGEPKASLASVQKHFYLPDLLDRVSNVIRTREIADCEFRKEGGHCFQIRMTPYMTGKATVASGVVIAINDVTEKKTAEEKLKLSASVFEHASEATIITDPANRILSVNPAFTEITGYLPEEVIGKTPHLLNSGTHSKEFFKQLWDTLHSVGTWRGEVQNRRKNGELYTELLSIKVLRDDEGRIVRHIGVFSDVSHLKAAQETIQRQATFDSLTGLPNRDLTRDRLGQLLSSCRRSGGMFAVIFLDLDHFKLVNDSLGHSAGDELLVTIGSRIKHVLRESDSVGRMGGDEFIVLLNDLHSAEDIIPIADKILAEIRQPMTVAGRRIQSAASMGITIYPMDGDSAEAMLKNADSAMYAAKKAGRNNYCFFTHRMQEEAERRHWIDSELGTVLQNGRLHVYYQPIMQIGTMAIAGAEALMRWNHPCSGFISPEAFIPVAEQNGMIGDLSLWMIESGLRTWSEWTRASGTPLSLAFNLSAAQFVARDHIERLLGVLNRRDLPNGHQVVVEITESLRLCDSEGYLDVLHRLKDAGCRIAIDDFGTGYSSLSYLKRMPIDIIKIDKSFVRNISTDPVDAAMVRAILQMADAFGMTTVAEGVETPEQLAFLTQHGCNCAQGFMFSEPLPADAFVAFLRDSGQRKTDLFPLIHH